MVELPDDLTDEVTAAWERVDGLTLAQAYARFTEGLVTRPHPWAQKHLSLDLEASSDLGSKRVIRLALLALGELPTSDTRRFERPVEEPWYRAYSLLLDLCREPARFEALPSSVAWLAVDALIDAGASDSRHNSEQAASGWIWTMVARRRESPRLAERRLLDLAARSFTADGYDTGSMDADLADLADHVDDPRWRAELRLTHAYLSYATAPGETRRRAGLGEALSAAKELGLNVPAIRSRCLQIIGSWSEETLPTHADEIPAVG